MADEWTYVDEPTRQLTPEEMAIVRGGTMGPPKGKETTVGQKSMTLRDRYSEAYDRATSLAGTGEIGSLGRAMEDLFNIDDALQQATVGGSSEEREASRDDDRVRKVREQRALWQAMDEADPAWRENGNLFGNVARFSAGLLGDTAGNINPTYLIGGGSGPLKRIFTQGLANAGIDVALQGNEMREGIQDEFDPGRAAIQGLAGVLLQSGGELSAKVLGPLFKKAFGRDIPEGDFNSDDFAREEIVGDLNATHSREEDILPESYPEETLGTVEKLEDLSGQGREGPEVTIYTPEELEQRINTKLVQLEEPDEIQYRTPEEEAIVQDAIQEVANKWNADPATMGDDPAMFNRVQDAIEARGGNRGYLNKEMAPEVEEPRVDELRPEVVGMRQIANQIHIDAETGGGQYNIGQIGAIMKALDEKEAAGQFNPSEMEEVGNIRAFLEDAAVMHSERQTVNEAETGIADGPPPVEPVQPNRGAGNLPKAANQNSVEGSTGNPNLDAALDKRMQEQVEADQNNPLVYDPISGWFVEGGRPANDMGSGGMEPPREPPTGGEGGGGEPPRPVHERLTEALNSAKRLTAEQKRMYTEERSNRLKSVVAAREAGVGEEGYHAELAALKGEMPKVDYEGVREQFTPEEVNGLFDEIKNSDAFGRSLYEPITARTGLARILDGQVPRPSEIAALEKVFGPELVKAAVQHKSKGGKVADLLSQGLNLPRSLMASMDLSAPFRQGIFLVGSKQFWKAWPDMFKAFGSERAFNGIMDDIRSRETFPLMEESNLAVTDLGGNLSNREEDFISQWAEKIPVVGKGVKASERAYVGFLNKLRADTFDSLVSKYNEQGIDLSENSKALKDIATFVNNATGRGDLGKQGNAAAPFLNGLFFSPRLIASRVNLLRPDTYIRLDPIVRKEALKSLMSFGAIATTVAGLAAQAGLDVETDPRSSDFAKIRDGNTRYDILGGFGQYLTLAARLATNETKTLKGDVKELGKGYKEDTRVDVIERFLENKFAPVPGYIRDYLQGKDPVGNEFEVKRDTAELFIPLLWQDIYEMYEEEGLAGLAKGTPGIFGVGTSTFKPKGEKTEEVAEDDGWEYQDDSSDDGWVYQN